MSSDYSVRMIIAIFLLYPFIELKRWSIFFPTVCTVWKLCIFACTNKVDSRFTMKLTIFRNPFRNATNWTNNFTVQSLLAFLFVRAINPDIPCFASNEKHGEWNVKMHNTYHIIWLWLRCRRYYFLICICNRWNRICVSVLWWVSFVWHTLNFLFHA